MVSLIHFSHKAVLPEYIRKDPTTSEEKSQKDSKAVFDRYNTPDERPTGQEEIVRIKIIVYIRGVSNNVTLNSKHPFLRHPFPLVLNALYC